MQQIDLGRQIQLWRLQFLAKYESVKMSRLKGDPIIETMTLVLFKCDYVLD